MLYIILVSLIWPFSFGLIKNSLAGIDASFVSCIRLFLSFLVFIPFFKWSILKDKIYSLKLFIVGMLQYGIMYIMYISAFKYLMAYEIALFTIFTPIYVSFVNDFFYKKFSKVNMFTAFLALIGAGIIKYAEIKSEMMWGFFLVQISNLCFAFGQVYYKKIVKAKDKDKEIFALPFFGSFVISLVFSLFITDFSNIILNNKQIFILLYLGIIASGVCFFLWNFGARKVNNGILAIFNNLKIPLAIFVSIIFFNEKTNLIKLFIGSSILIIALILNNLSKKNKVENL